jgi:hypothetical protein
MDISIPIVIKFLKHRPESVVKDSKILKNIIKEFEDKSGRC